MERNKIQNDLNYIIKVLNSINKSFFEAMLFEDYSEIKPYQFNNEASEKAYQIIDKAFYIVITNVNELIKNTNSLGLVDLITGNKVKSVEYINIHYISISDADRVYLNKINELYQHINKVIELGGAFGFIDQNQFSKEDGYPEITVKKDLYDAPSKSYYTMIYIPYRDRYGEYIELKHGLPQDRLKFTKTYEKPSDFYKRHSTATVISSGSPDHHGVSIVDGVVAENIPTKNARPLAYMNDGTLKVFSDTTTADEFLEAGAKHVWGSFWPFIIDGKKVSPSNDESYVDRLNKKHDPRAIVAQLKNKDKLIISVHGRFENSPGMTLSQMQDFILSIPDIELAYNMDGGGSEHAIVNGEYITPMYDNDRTTERAVWDFVYIERSKAPSVTDNKELLDSLKETTKEAIKRYGKVKLFED